MRPDINSYFLEMAELVATRGTCRRRQVGCVLTNHRNHVLGTGYNGVPSGIRHCIDVPCPGVGFKSGLGLEECQAVHAEMNALLQCHNVNEIFTCYTTTSPCITCTKLLLNTSCTRIIFAEEYPHHEAGELWQSQKRGWFLCS